MEIVRQTPSASATAVPATSHPTRDTQYARTTWDDPEEEVRQEQEQQASNEAPDQERKQ